MAKCLTLKKSNCKNCYKCIRHCPVKSIRFSGNQAHIIEDECILCGQCFVVCPQNAKQIVDEREKVKVFLQSGVPVYVSLAPSFIANYEGAGMRSMQKALQKLGFADAEETALGATMVKREYERMLREEKRDVLITSCCHSVNLLVQKYFPHLLPYLADTLSPMQAHCADLKRRHPDCKTVFIGPCVAKKDEAEHYPEYVDAVLTFEELSRWLDEEKIELEREQEESEEGLARFFPTTGGILKTLTERLPEYHYLAVDGVENCIATLREIEEGKVRNVLIEMSACVGSCIGGPVMDKTRRSLIKDYITVADFATEKDFSVPQPDVCFLQKRFTPIEKKMDEPTEEEIAFALRQMGKSRPMDELNCGSCGYNTCREKAIAICQGKADVSMCLPFLKEKAESFSDTIVKNTPNGLFVLNENLEVQQINESARRIMNIRAQSDVLGCPVERILDPAPFERVKSTGMGMRGRRVYLAEYERYVEQTIVYDREYKLIVCILRDVTDEEKERQQKEAFSRQTVQTADRVVEKQMRIVQEIASLLGETAAETKIALTKLKESIGDER